MVKRKGLPEMNELVMCTVRKITPYAAWCTLDEYGGREGMIHVSEAAGKWVHDIREFVKQDKQYVAKVVRIDAEKGLINLSLKRLSRKDEKEKQNSYRSEQRSEKILEQAGNLLGKTLDKAYEEAGYVLQEKFGELSTAFEEARKEPGRLEEAGLSKKWAEALMPIIEKAIKEKEVVLKVEIDAKSYDKDGLEKVKSIMAILKKAGLQVSYISAPRYTAQMQTKDPKNDEKKMFAKLNEAQEKARQSNVEFEYKPVK